MVVAILVLPLVSLHAETGPNLAAFDKEIKPLLNKYCISCHGPEESEASLRIDQLDPDLVSGVDGDSWEEVYNQLNIGDMPPDDEEQPTVAERDKISEWVHTQLHHAALVKRSTGGRNVLRRMTAYEYSNSLRDLLGVDINHAEDLPPEAAAHEGFVNNYEVLGTSSLHLEYFHTIAKDALNKALMFGDKPFIFEYHFDAHEREAKVQAKLEAAKKKADKMVADGEKTRENADRSLIKVMKTAITKGRLIEGGGVELSPGGWFYQDIPRSNKNGRIPETGPMRVTVRAAGIKNGSSLTPHMMVNIGFDPVTKARPFKTIANIPLESEEYQDFVFDFHADNFPIYLPGHAPTQFIDVINSIHTGTSDLTDDQLPKIKFESIRLEAPYYESWPPKTRTQITDVTEHEEGSAKAVRDILSHFMTRAFRRPVVKDEVDRMLALYEKLRANEMAYEDALIDTLATVLSSPAFLYLAEPKGGDGKSNAPRDLNDYELATRLSYFLWSTKPDRELYKLASEKKLKDRNILTAQIERMLADPKAEEFSKNFTSQWLGLDGIYTVAVNPEFFPEFNDDMKDVFTEETLKTFNYILSNNRSVLELIDSEQVVVNSFLANYYGIPGVAGDHFRPVDLDASSPRGGLLSQASVLTLNSSGDDTDPIKRGVWLLERLLGDPPPPPPPGVPPLDQEEAVVGNKSLRQRLEAHRNHESCASCHAKIDPWGVAFENFDGVGRWRNNQKGAASGTSEKPKGRNKGRVSKAEMSRLNAYVDPGTKLVDGTAISNLEELKAYILDEKRDQFSENFVRRMMGYALGRHLDFTDRGSIEDLTNEFAADDYRPRGLIKNIILSDSFLKK